MTEQPSVNFTPVDDAVVIGFDTPVITGGRGIETVQQQIRQYVERHSPQRVVVDLAGVRFFSSTMLGLLVDLWKRLRKDGGNLVICGVSPQLHRLFEITNLNTIFTFAPDRQAALEKIST